ncbi:MAG: polymorphic toxin type 50 domain-containing protein [Bacteroidota bacterium]
MPIVKFNFNIGTAITLSGNQGATAYGVIHVSRGGVHVVPVPVN